MSGELIGVVGERYDDEVLALSRALRARGARVRVLDFTGLPGAHVLSIHDDEAVYDGRPLSSLEAIYIRRLRLAPDEDRLRGASEAGWLEALDEWLEQMRAEREISALIWSALGLIEAPVINSLGAQLVHPRKVHHLRTLSRAGLPVPPLVATNDKAAIKAFLKEQRQRSSGVVIKPLRGLLKTQLLGDEQSVSELPISRRPVLLQRLVSGVTIRVYAVAGLSVAAGELRNSGHVDSSVDPKAVQLVPLTGEELSIVGRASRAADLPFTGMDLQRPEGGGQVQVLECNAAPMFSNFSRRTGADVAGPLAEYLIHRARGGAVWEVR